MDRDQLPHDNQCDRSPMSDIDRMWYLQQLRDYPHPLRGGLRGEQHKELAELEAAYRKGELD